MADRGRGIPLAASGRTGVNCSEAMAGRPAAKVGENGRRAVMAVVTLEIAFVRNRLGQARRVSSTAVGGVATSLMASLRQRESRCRRSRAIVTMENGGPVLSLLCVVVGDGISRRIATTNGIGRGKVRGPRRETSHGGVVRVAATMDSLGVPSRTAIKATITAVRSP